MYFDTSLKTSRRDYSGLSGPGGLSEREIPQIFFSSKRGMETRREEIDPFEGIDDPTLRVQMQHEMRAIEELVFVTKLSFVPAHKDKAQGFRATLSCALCRWYDSCGKGQEQAVQLSRERTTLLACLQELRKRLQDRHGFRCAQAVAKKAAADAASPATVDPDTPNVLQAMMKLEQAKARAKTANKVALEAEKERDAAETAVEELKTSHISSRKRISTSGLRDLPSMRSGSRWYGSNLVALVMGKVRGMASEPWQNQRSLSTSCTGSSAR